MSRVVADVRGVVVVDVRRIGGKTREVAAGIETCASRGVVVAGNAVAQAACEGREKVERAAATLVEASEADLEVADGRVFVRGAPTRGMALGAIVQSSLPTFQGPRVADPIFEASVYHTVPTVTFASAAHVALVEVDPETGVVTILRYVIAHACGRVVNPRIVDGQIHGGVAQGVGGGLWETIVYDTAGQILTSSLMDYVVPKARDLPRFEAIHLESPSPGNPLGVKGVGESGTPASLAAVMNAVADALPECPDIDMPATPERVWRAIQAGKANRGR